MRLRASLGRFEELISKLLFEYILFSLILLSMNCFQYNVKVVRWTYNGLLETELVNKN